MSKTAGETPGMIVRRPEERQGIPNPVGESMIFKLTGAETGGAISMFEATPRPGSGPPLHVHANEAEIICVLEGNIRFQLGDQSWETTAGGFAFIPGGLKHTWQVVGSEPARLMFFLTPASPGIERFFSAFADVPADAQLQQEFNRLGPEAGMEIVGPPVDFVPWPKPALAD